MKCQTPRRHVYNIYIFIQSFIPEANIPPTKQTDNNNKKNPIGILYPYFKILYRFTRFPFSINFSGLGFSVIGKQENRNKKK